MIRAGGPPVIFASRRSPRCDCRMCGQSPPWTSLPAVQNPDVDDWTISPRSFSAQAIEVVGQDSCETLLISNAPVQQYGFTQIIRAPNDKDEQLQPAEPSPCEPKGNLAPALCFRRGAVVEYEATWQPMGHGLGEVLYSLPLAPCGMKINSRRFCSTATSARASTPSVAGWSGRPLPARRSMATSPA
jgi:hypothetical protein